LTRSAPLFFHPIANYFRVNANSRQITYVK
jgi:hypothetical protein